MFKKTDINPEFKKAMTTPAFKRAEFINKIDYTQLYMGKIWECTAMGVLAAVLYDCITPLIHLIGIGTSPYDGAWLMLCGFTMGLGISKALIEQEREKRGQQDFT